MIKRFERGIARKIGISGAMVVLIALLPMANLQAQDDPFGANWPEGEGRNLTGAWCGGCHSLNLVTQQGLTRDGWDVLLDWMSEKQKMPPLQGEQRDTVLDYLAANFGIDHNGGERTSITDSEGFSTLNPVQGINHRPMLEIRPAE
ncbi:hypothetical protein ACUNV4_16555 [Granulosicoccus sp. 3-233]|uniref:hypothetical protein n=1 Tax=Granulosicoccus sp. 3-233 TaxID=3417969 RepID=UPI003D357AE7